MLADGNRAYAKRLFKQASEAGGEIGGAASAAYTKLDIADAPQNYLRAEPFFEDDSDGAGGEVVVEVENPTAYPLRDIVLRVNASVNAQPVHRRLSLKRLNPGAVKVVPSRIYYRAEDEAEVEARVLQAVAVD